ncbi:phosphoglycerate kinase [Flavobacteriales bacterium]|nr:phosphoglycerate kinase [Flavobacteriales bacterium]MDB4195401.1 phosphoglycerate kinase [Flavobacteriales bacterium]MDB9702057.1 phosphoglycerate kinase [Flavobacteriales bacterium]
MMSFKDLNFSNKKVLVRVDFNVPLEPDTFRITDDTRMKAALPTLNKVLNDGGSLVIMSHLGRPKLGFEEKFSLKHIVSHLGDLLNKEIQFCGDSIGEEAQKMSSELKPGQVLLIENLRFYKHETSGNLYFAEELSKLGDFYVNDAFGTAHRAHASTTMVANFFTGKKSFGNLLENEINSLEKVLSAPKKPFTAIIGGAKVSGKINVIENLLDKVTDIIIGGGMSYTFIKAQGGKIGSSLVEDNQISTAKDILKKAEKLGVNLHIPTDTVIADSFSNDANTDECDIFEIPDGWMGLDIGTKSIKQFKEVISRSSTILWNGPMGVFEMESFEKGTKAIAYSVVEATKNGAYSLVGGGDSVAAINRYNLGDEVSYVSTGGGAMLEYLEGKELPGVIAINQKEGFRLNED